MTTQKSSGSLVFPTILKEVFDAFGTAVCMLNKQRTILYANPAFKELFLPNPQEQAEGKRFGVSISCRETKVDQTKQVCGSCRFQKEVTAAFADQQTREKQVMVMQLSEDHIHPLRLIRFEVCYVPHGTESFVVALFEDMTNTGDAAASIPYDTIPHQDDRE
jgi:PAS domain-containing protein